MKYDIIAGVNFPHRLETGKTSAEVDAWCKENNHVRLNRDRQIGNYTASEGRKEAARPPCASSRTGADGHDSGARDGGAEGRIRAARREGLACARTEPEAEEVKHNAIYGAKPAP